MSGRPLTTIFLASLTFVVTLLVGILSHEAIKTSILSAPEAPLTGIKLELAKTEDETDGKYGEWTYCDYTLPETAQYNAEFQSAKVDENIAPGGVFTVDMTLKNTGNTRLYSADSGCPNAPVLNIGTQKSQDRESVFGSGESAMAGWKGPTRIKMSENYVESGEEFHVIFQSLAPEGHNVYREFFQPVVEGEAWVGSIFNVDIAVGSPSDQMKSNITYVKEETMNAAELEGLEKKVEISLSEQEMYVKFGDKTVWELQISSGAWDTPTPRGNYKILSKQDLRIGGKAPHYRMPYFQMWDSRGYGLHALPYLANDGGTFWTEALTHIGVPVSHGCIRMLPDDAILLYSFTDIGTPVTIY